MATKLEVLLKVLSKNFHMNQTSKLLSLLEVNV